MSFTKILRLTGAAGVVVSLIASCGAEPEPETGYQPLEVVEPRPDIYADFTLTADLDGLHSVPSLK